jgi:transposase
LLAELRERQHTSLERAKRRQRVFAGDPLFAGEHPLAHVGHWQGRRARYRGLRQNVFDLRRCAVVDNLYIMSHLPLFADDPPQDKEAA